MTGRPEPQSIQGDRISPPRLPNPERLPRWLPFALAVIGLAVYLGFAIRFAHTQASVLDEGMYLYKGWLFATGRYTPFQDFGPWTNHMPLSFLVPGWVQVLFGPGLMTGRALAVGIGVLSVTGIWTLARRFGGAWWAAAAVWAIALNPAVTKIFSVQASQGLAACTLIGALVFTLGHERRDWEVAVGGILSGALALTRVNLAPVLPVLAVYVFAGRGRRAGLIFTGAGFAIFAIGHAVYWPGILRLWAPWLPDALTPFLDAFRRPANDGGLWSPEVMLRSRLASLMQGLRFHLLPFAAVAAVLIFRPFRDPGWERGRKAVSVVLLVLFGLLAAMHAWAALGQDYCVFCFPVYLSFFSLPALILFPLTFPHWDPEIRSPRWAAVIVLAACGLLAASAFDVVGPGLLEQPAVVRLLRTEVPRTSGSGTIPLWGLVENLTGRDYETIVRSTLLTGRTVLAGTIGLAAGLAAMAIARRLPLDGRPFAHRVGAAVLALGLFFSPTPFLAGGYRTYDCTGDVIAAAETAGAQLAGMIPPDARVYWGTGNSPAVLLYVPGIRIFPAQLNGAYSFKLGGDPEALERFGHWNRVLAERWLAEADVVLVTAGAFGAEGMAWLEPAVAAAGFSSVQVTTPVHPCDPGSAIRVYQRP